MEEQLNLETPEEQEATRVEQRIRGLNSEKAKLAADKEELSKAKIEADAKAEAAIKDAEFYKNFNTSASKYQGATEFQDKIKELHAKGYDMEDAMVAVLNKEGKLNPVAPIVQKTSPTGGSAPTILKSGEKPISEMTRAEMRAELVEAEKRGEIGLN